MSNNIDDRTDALVKNLVQSRNRYRMLIKEIESKLMELSKKYEITIMLDK